MDTVVAATITQPRLQLQLFALFAAFAALLTAIGLHSVVAFSVAQRTRECGIRFALGARPREVLLLVTREAGRLVVIGLSVGLGAALIAALVLGLFNTLVRPLLVLLTLPVTLLTLGLFLFVINALMFWAAASVLAGFNVAGFSAALIGSLLYSACGMVIDVATEKIFSQSA